MTQQIDTTDRRTAFDLLSRPLLAVNLGLVALANGVFISLRDQLPESVPVHMTVTGKPTRYGSPDELWMVGIVLLATALLPILAAMLATRAPDADREQSEHVQTLNWDYRRRSVRLVEGIILGENSAIAFLWLGTAYAALPGHAGLLLHVASGMSILLLLGIAIPMGLMLPGLVRAGNALTEARPNERRAEHFKGGLFYVNRDDPALWVPKLAGLGYTLNFAHRRAWLLMALLLGLPTLLVLLPVIRH